MRTRGDTRGHERTERVNHTPRTVVIDEGPLSEFASMTTLAGLLGEMYGRQTTQAFHNIVTPRRVPHPWAPVPYVAHRPMIDAERLGWQCLYCEADFHFDPVRGYYELHLADGRVRAVREAEPIPPCEATSIDFLGGHVFHTDDFDRLPQDFIWTHDVLCALCGEIATADEHSAPCRATGLGRLVPKAVRTFWAGDVVRRTGDAEEREIASIDDLGCLRFVGAERLHGFRPEGWAFVRRVERPLAVEAPPPARAPGFAERMVKAGQNGTMRAEPDGPEMMTRGRVIGASYRLLLGRQEHGLACDVCGVTFDADAERRPRAGCRRVCTPCSRRAMGLRGVPT